MPVIHTRTFVPRAVTVIGVASTLAVAALAAPHVTAEASTPPGYDGRITFESTRADGTPQVYTMKSDGTDLHQVTSGTTYGNNSPQFLPYSSDLTFVATAADQPGSIKITDANGVSQLLANPRLTDGSTCSRPSQPTVYVGATVVFTCGERTNAGVAYPEHNLWWSNLLSFDQPAYHVTNSASAQDYEDAASVSPSGNTVVFQSFHHDDATNVNSDFKLETVNVNGTGRTVLTTAPSGGGVYDPEWSPDGKTILFEQATSSDNATNELYVMPAAGGTKTRLTHDAVAELHPTWSPDGRKILFSMVATNCSCVTLATMMPTPTDVPHPIGNAATWNSGHWNNFSPHWQSVRDTVAPTTPVITGARPFTLSKVALHLSSTDAGSGVAWYVERFEHASWTSTTWSAWSMWSTVGSSTWTSPTLTTGDTDCFQFTAVDRGQNISQAGETCSARPVQETAATYAGGWKHVASSAYYGGAANRSSAKGSSLTLHGFHGDRIGLLTRTCATCGAIKVYVAGVLYGTLDTHSSTTHTRDWRLLPRFTATSGTVKLVTTSAKPVYVDAIGLSKK